MKRNRYHRTVAPFLPLVLVVALCLLPQEAAAQHLQREAGLHPAQPISLPGGPAVLLYDQTDFASGNGAPSQEFEFDPGGTACLGQGLHFCDSQGADDFQVPAGKNWTIETVFAPGLTTLFVTITNVDVAIYADAGGLPGPVVYAETDIVPADASGDLTMDLSAPPILPAGHYWVSVVADIDFATHGQWFWSNRTAQSFNESAWQNPLDGFLTGCTSWAPQTVCGAGGGASPDFLFALFGTETTATNLADLGVTKQTSNMTPAYGETITFTITVANDGPANAMNVVVTDLLPAGLTFVSASSTQGGYVSGTGLWGVGTLNAGDTATLTILATVNTLDPVVNTATITNASTSDPDPTNNTDSVTITPQGADLAVDKTVDNTTPALGDTITFTITITNLDGADVSNVRVTDQLPTGLIFVDATASQGTFNAGSWNVGGLQEGDMATLDIRAVVNTTNPITNRAFIAFSNLIDPNPGNNSDTASLNTRAADLELTKLATSFERDNGGFTATFEVEVVNEGPSDVTGVEVADVLSPDMTLISVAVTKGAVSTALPAVNWEVGDLDVGKSALMIITVSIPGDGSLLNIAEVTASDLPDPDSVPGDGQGDDFAAATAGLRPPPDFVPEGGPRGIINRGDRFTADLALSKGVDVRGAPIGGEVKYEVTVQNLGPQSTAKVEVTDHLPGCLVEATWTASRGTYDGWIWDIGKLKVGETVTLEVVAKVGPDCVESVTNTAKITASSLPDPDDNPSLLDDPPEQDNEASATFTVSTTNRVLDGSTFALGANYPNPFNPATVIPYSLAEASRVTITVYDLLGRSVATLVDAAMPAGVHEVVFDAGHLPTGLYIARMEAAGLVKTQRITLLR